MVRNIIWDVDGTLFDTYPAIVESIRAAVDSLGESVSPEWIEGLVKNSLRHCVTVLADTYGWSQADIERAFEEHYALVSAEDTLPFPGVKKLCRYINEIGGRNFIVTHRGRKGTTELLNAHDMAGYFSGAVVRDDGYARKPDPAAFDAVIEKYGLDREETLTVGDREIDIEAGQRAGLFSCYFGSEPVETKADLVVSRMDDLYEYIVSKNG
jgi:HAD superfamily hydrolase (TIGR01549 family)